jgi:hypothetical protein
MVLVFAQEMLLNMDDIIIAKGRNWLIRKQRGVIKSLWQDPPDIPVESLFAHPHKCCIVQDMGRPLTEVAHEVGHLCGYIMRAPPQTLRLAIWLIQKELKRLLRTGHQMRSA